MRAKAAQEAVNSGLLFTDEEAEEQQPAADSTRRRRGSARRSHHDSPVVLKDQPQAPRAAAGTAIGMNEKIQRALFTTRRCLICVTLIAPTKCDHISIRREGFYLRCRQGG